MNHIHTHILHTYLCMYICYRHHTTMNNYEKCICIQKYICIYIHTCTFMYIKMYKGTFMHTYMHRYKYRKKPCIHTYRLCNMFVDNKGHRDIITRIHMYINSYIHTSKYVQVKTFSKHRPYWPYTCGTQTNE